MDRRVRKNKDRLSFSQTFHISNLRVGDAKNGFHNDFLDAFYFYIDFVQRLSRYE